MKKLLSIGLVFSFLVALGLPGIHGVTGRDWGQAVSGLAKDHPGAVAHHIMNM